MVRHFTLLCTELNITDLVTFNANEASGEFVFIVKQHILWDFRRTLPVFRKSFFVQT